MHITSHINSHESHGLTAWLWLCRMLGQAKANARPTVWPGLARPTLAWLGLAFGLRPSHAHHYVAHSLGALIVGAFIQQPCLPPSVDAFFPCIPMVIIADLHPTCPHICDSKAWLGPSRTWSS